jgi:hypothetical protein
VRWHIVEPGPGGPYVYAAIASDPAWPGDDLEGHRAGLDHVGSDRARALTREELEETPESRAALAAWEREDDSAHQARIRDQVTGDEIDDLEAMFLGE